MIKRLSWFVGGAAAGVAGTGYVKRKAKAVAAQLSPNHVAKVAADRARDRLHDVGDALREGRSAMRSKERELRARRDGSAAEVVVETGVIESGVVVVDAPGLAADPEAGRVIVLREARAEAETPRRRRARG